MADLSPYLQKRLVDEIYAVSLPAAEQNFSKRTKIHQTPAKNNPDLMALPCDRALWFGLGGASPRAACGPPARAWVCTRLAKRALLRDLRRAGYRVDWNAPLDCGSIYGLSRRPQLLDIQIVSECTFRRLAKFGLGAVIDLEIALHCRLGFAGLTMALFVAENKNTQELYCEKICFDQEIFKQAEDRADELLSRSQAPAGNFDENCFSCGFLSSCRDFDKYV